MSTPFPRRDMSLDDIIELLQAFLTGIAFGSVTLTANAATTLVETRRTRFLDTNNELLLMPKTANAAAEAGNGTLFVSAIDEGSFTLTHANTAQTDRTFSWFAFRK